MFNRLIVRQSTAVDAAPMADIAFLMLIFFLVVTRISSEKGMRIILPSMSAVQTNQAMARMDLVLNSKGEVLLDKKPFELAALQSQLQQFVIDNLLISKAIHFSVSRELNYSDYIMLYDWLLAARQAGLNHLSIYNGWDRYETLAPDQKAQLMEQLDLHINKVFY